MEAKKFGQFIAGIRKEKKMTQAELAEKIHVTDKAISRWERGLGFPDIQTLEPLAQVLGISVLELMRSEKKKPTGDMDTTETQYTQKEGAEMLQNADDISKQLKKQDKNANIIAGILVIGVGALAWATKIASLGGGLVLGGLSAAVFVSLWYFFQNIDDEESLRIYGVASILSIGILVSLVNYIWGDRIAEWIPGGIERTEQIFWTLWYLFMIAIIAAIILLVLKKDMFSIIPTAISAVIFVISLVAVNFRGYYGRNKYDIYSLTNLLSSGNGSDDAKYVLGLGVYVLIVGYILAIAGCFIDIMKYFKKDLGVDSRYLSNSINKSVWKTMYYYRGFYIMFLPVLIMIILFNYWPMAGCRYAFTKYVIAGPYYVGLKHFVQMFTNDLYFWTAFRNTLILSIIKLILNTGAAVIISLLLNEIVSLGFKKTVQTIVYLPHFMSWVVVASVFKMILDPNVTGVVNSLLLKANMINEPIYFLGDSKYWRGTFYVMNVWKDTGWGTILFLATLSGISPDLYEAAQIDGANRWKRLIYITLPALANTIITVFILNLAKVMNLFESVFVTMNNAVLDVAEVLQTYVYRKTFSSGNSDYGYTTAVGLFKSFVGMILVLSCNYASKKVRGRGIV